MSYCEPFKTKAWHKLCESSRVICGFLSIYAQWLRQQREHKNIHTKFFQIHSNKINDKAKRWHEERRTANTKLYRKEDVVNQRTHALIALQLQCPNCNNEINPCHHNRCCEKTMVMHNYFHNHTAWAVSTFCQITLEHIFNWHGR